MRKKILLLCLISSFSLQAAIPTMEGLFRNGNSPDLNGELVVVRLMIEENNNEALLRKVKIEDQEPLDETLDPILLEKGDKSKFVKFIFSIERNNRIGVIQIEYANNQMKYSEIDRVEYIPNLLKDIDLDANLERRLFYSMVLMYALNDSRAISGNLKKLDFEFKTNKEIINQEKIDLLKKYQRYLESIKKEPDLRGVIPNPLKPDDVEELIKVKEMLTSSIYLKSNRVQLIRKKGKFYWEINLTNIYALFHNETNRLDTLKVTTFNGEMDIRLGEYILFDGIHELPKNMVIKTTKQRLFKVVFLDYKNFSKSKRSLSSRAKEYKKHLAEQYRVKGFNKNSTDVGGGENLEKISKIFLF